MSRPFQTSQQEIVRIQEEYLRRDKEIPEGYYSLTSPAIHFRHVNRTRGVHNLLREANLIPLTDKTILDVGCGKGDWLADCESWGATQCNLHGIDLDKTRSRIAKSRLSAADIRHGDAQTLPWDDGHFDILIQATLFTSILSDKIKKNIAKEMTRALKADGVILWYDFRFGNPQNQNVKGIKETEIHKLFSDCSVHLLKTTLAPPIAQRLVPFSWVFCLLLEKIPLLRTHYLGLIRKTI